MKLLGHSDEEGWYEQTTIFQQILTLEGCSEFGAVCFICKNTAGQKDERLNDL